MGKEKQIKRVPKKTKEDKVEKISELREVEDLFMNSGSLSLEEMDKLILRYKENLQKLKEGDYSNLAKIVKSAKTAKNLKESMVESLSESLKKEYEDLKESISEKRKKGFDSLIVDLKMMSIAYKIKIFESTSDKKDYLKVKKILHDIKIITDEFHIPIKEESD